MNHLLNTIAAADGGNPVVFLGLAVLGLLLILAPFLLLGKSTSVLRKLDDANKTLKGIERLLAAGQWKDRDGQF